MTAFWVNRLNESDSRLHKEEVLRQALSAATLGEFEPQVFLGLLKATYDPFITFGVKQVPVTVGLTDRENPWQDFNDLLNRLHMRTLTGNAARDALQELSQRFDSEQWNKFCAAVIQKDIRAGVSDKTINKIAKDTQYEVPIYGCQLATSGDDREITGRQRLEPKLDGVRMQLHVMFGEGDVYAFSYSRNGKLFDNFTHIEREVLDNITALIRSSRQSALYERGFVLDGEVTGSSFQELMRQARRKRDVQADDTVFHVFDIIPLEEFNAGWWQKPLEQRLDILHSMREIFGRMKSVALLPSIEVDLDYAEGRDVMHRYGRDCVEQGYEGIMIKDLRAPYECKRNTHWLKWKPTITVDLEVIDVEEGTGKNAGRLGALVCSGTDNGRVITVNVGSGYSDAERDALWSDRDLVIGRTVEVLADTVSQNQDGTYSLRFPRFSRFRDVLTGEKE